jgi:hypothetical protein
MNCPKHGHRVILDFSLIVASSIVKGPLINLMVVDFVQNWESLRRSWQASYNPYYDNTLSGAVSSLEATARFVQFQLECRVLQEDTAKYTEVW